jgi:hypothetical protein
MIIRLNHLASIDLVAVPNIQVFTSTPLILWGSVYEGRQSHVFLWKVKTTQQLDALYYAHDRKFLTYDFNFHNNILTNVQKD